jgi:hypothetical protein
MHLYGTIGGMDDRHKLQEERPPKNTVVPDVELLGASVLLCASRPSRYVLVINDNHLVSLINFNAAKVD